jgi:hypothetical protein
MYAGMSMHDQLCALSGHLFVSSTLYDEPAHHNHPELPMFVKVIAATKNAHREDAQRRWVIVHPVDIQPELGRIRLSQQDVKGPMCLQQSKLQKMQLKFSPDGEPTLHKGKQKYVPHVPGRTIQINLTT